MSASVTVPVAPSSDSPGVKGHEKSSADRSRLDDAREKFTGDGVDGGNCEHNALSSEGKIDQELNYKQEFKINNAIHVHENGECDALDYNNSADDSNVESQNTAKACLRESMEAGNKYNNCVLKRHSDISSKRVISLDEIPELTPSGCDIDPDTCVSLPADFVLNGSQPLRDACNCSPRNNVISTSLTALPGEELLSNGGAFVSDGLKGKSSQSEDCIVRLRSSSGRENLVGQVSQSYTRYVSGAFEFLKDEGLTEGSEQREGGRLELSGECNGQSCISVIQEAASEEIAKEPFEKRTFAIGAMKQGSATSQRDSSASIVSNLSSLSETSCASDSPDSQTVIGCSNNNIEKAAECSVEKGKVPDKVTNVDDSSGSWSTPGKVPGSPLEHSCSHGNTEKCISSSVSQDTTDSCEKQPAEKTVLEASTCSSVNGAEQETTTTAPAAGDATQSPADIPNVGEKQGNASPAVEDIDTPVTRRRSSKRRDQSLKTEDSCEVDSDDSSDEDSGVYAESHRNSHWIKVDDDGTLTLPSMPYTISEDVDQSDGDLGISPDVASGSPKDDDVFSEAFAEGQKSHKRTDSMTTTASESEFRNKFRFLRKRSVQRHNSHQQFYRMSTKYYEDEMTITMEKDVGHVDFGLHILDSHPAVISAVIPGSTAEKAGVTAGQILVSVNGINVLAASHGEIIKLMQLNPELLTIAVGQSDVMHSRDLQEPVLAGYLSKLAGSGLIKLWRKRWFVLRQDNCLYYYKTENDKDPLGAVPLTDYMVAKALEVTRDFAFKLEKYGARTYYFATDSDESRKKWANAMTLAARSTLKTETWLDVTSHNVGIPALSLRNPECTGYLSKMGEARKAWRKRYCVLKDACIYYYKGIGSYSAQGVAHLHGYQLERDVNCSKKHAFKLFPPEPNMRTFLFATENATDRERWMESMVKSIGRWKRISASS